MENNLNFSNEGDDLTLFTLKLKDFEEIKPCLRDIDSDGDSDVSDLDDSDSDTEAEPVQLQDSRKIYQKKGDAQVDDTVLSHLSQKEIILLHHCK